MKRSITIVGCGVGSKQLLTKEATEAIANSQYLLGAERLISQYPQPQKICTRNHEIVEQIRNDTVHDRIAVLVSGDPGFFSAAKKLQIELEDEQVTVIPGISSLSYFCAQLGASWEDAAVISVHGRSGNVAGAVCQNVKTFVLTGGDYTVANVCAQLSKAGLGDVQVAIGERLSYPDEKITQGRAHEFARQSCDSLSVLLIQNKTPKILRKGMADDEIIRGDVPMSKFSVRAVSVAMLQLAPTDIVYDIGAGTGSVSIEIARHITDGAIYSIEKDAEGVALLHKNREKFCATNMHIVEVCAPEGMAELPAPDRVFVGGSGGNLEAIINAILEKNPYALMVVNAITLETLQEAMRIMTDKNMHPQATQLAATQVNKRGNYHMMQADNPVFILSGQVREP